MRKRLSLTKLIFLIALIVGICLGTGIKLTEVYSADHKKAVAQETNNTKEQSEFTDKLDKRVNLLLLGVDARPGWETSRSDTMILASIDPDFKKVALISIPRDTRVEVPGRGLDKICTANFVGGPELALTTVEKLTSLEIDYYIEADFNGFAEVVDTLGGVEVDVPQRMYKPKALIDLQPGLQRLNGKDALAFVRYRDYAKGDIDRTSKQQEFLKAFANEILQRDTVLKLPKLLKQFKQYVNTDMGLRDMFKIASLARDLTAESINTQTLPGYFYDERDNQGRLLSSYWEPDWDNIETLVDDVFAGSQLSTVKGTISQTVGDNGEEGDNKDGTEDNINLAEDVQTEEQPSAEDIENIEEEDKENDNSSLITDNEQDKGDEDSAAWVVGTEGDGEEQTETADTGKEQNVSDDKIEPETLPNDEENIIRDEQSAMQIKEEAPEALEEEKIIKKDESSPLQEL